MSEEQNSSANAIGRRKRATARVKLVNGTGSIKVNKRKLDEYFTNANLIRVVEKPLRLTNMVDKYEVNAILNGGGHSGQADAMSLGISRALIKIDPQLRAVLKKAGMLHRDPREKERKKYGQRGARRRFQFSKR